MSRYHGLACILALAASVVAHAAPPSEADWSRCADMDAADARLACYDALFHRAPRPADIASTTGAAAGAARAAKPAASTPPPVPFDPKSFGFTPEQTHTFDTGPTSITVHIKSIDVDQLGHTVVSLDNDQTWSVANNDGGLSEGAAVRIKHASLGAYILFTSSNHTYHVKRLH